MSRITLTKTQAVVLTIWACVSIAIGAEGEGYLADILLFFGGAMVCAALIVPTNRDHGDE